MRLEKPYMELREKHGNKYDTPRLRLWARMISTGLHSDYDTSPEIPAFLGSTPKRARRESLSDAISGAAVAFAGALKGREKDQEQPTSVVPSGTSGRSVELNYEQLYHQPSSISDPHCTHLFFQVRKVPSFANFKFQPLPSLTTCM